MGARILPNKHESRNAAKAAAPELTQKKDDFQVIGDASQ
jgi:hypothetical protein